MELLVDSLHEACTRPGSIGRDVSGLVALDHGAHASYFRDKSASLPLA